MSCRKTTSVNLKPVLTNKNLCLGKFKVGHKGTFLEAPKASKYINFLPLGIFHFMNFLLHNMVKKINPVNDIISEQDIQINHMYIAIRYGELWVNHR